MSNHRLEREPADLRSCTFSLVNLRCRSLTVSLFDLYGIELVLLRVGWLASQVIPSLERFGGSRTFHWNVNRESL